MAAENQRSGSIEQTDAGNDSGADSTTGGIVRRDDDAGGSADPISAVAGISRQTRRKPAESGSESESTGTGETGSARTRARTDGGGTKSRAKKSQNSRLDLNAEARKQLAKQVAGIHKLIGIAVGQPQLVAITDDQAENLTNAALDVMQHYDMSVSPVVAAWANLAAVCATIYAPKFLMFNAMRKQARSMHRQPQQDEQPVHGQANAFDFSAGG